MKVIVAHNFYQLPGGEDYVFRTESELLEERGHTVIRYRADNHKIRGLVSLATGVQAVWSQSKYEEFFRLVKRERPDVVHFHNTFPVMSPAVYYAARRAGAAVVQTVHNYRLACPAATLFRKGTVCETCVRKPVKWPAIQHGCYRGSRMATAATVAMLTVHRWIGTWTRKVDTFVAINGFVASKMVESGIPAEKLVVKPNCVHPDPRLGPGNGRYALFLGRLTEEKGIRILLDGWAHLGPDIPLKIVGEGPLAPLVAKRVADLPGVEWLGPQNRQQVVELLHSARLLVVPSIWYEGIPITILEGFATGVPVVASRLGSMERVIRHERTGLLFAAGQPESLAEQVRRLVSEPGLEARLRRSGRQDYEANYSGERTYRRLVEIYKISIRRRKETSRNGQ